MNHHPEDNLTLVNPEHRAELNCTRLSDLRRLSNKCLLPSADKFMLFYIHLLIMNASNLDIMESMGVGTIPSVLEWVRVPECKSFSL